MLRKILVICVLVAAVCSKELTDEQIERLTKFHADCLDDTQVDEDIVNKARQGNFPDDDKLKEFLFCMAKKIGFQNEDGEFQKDVMKQKLSDFFEDNDVDMLMQKCAVEKDTPQETAYQSMICYRENTPSHITLA